MSRVAKSPIRVPAGVEVQLGSGFVSAKGPKGELSLQLHPSVSVEREEDVIRVQQLESGSTAIAGTMRSLLNNLIVGVNLGFERKLTIIGVGYRAQMQGQSLTLSLGFSHPVNFKVPDGITIETPTQTEVVIKGIDKQLVGQTAAEIRRFRPPEPYKGKGVRYEGEYVARKQAKKI